MTEVTRMIYPLKGYKIRMPEQNYIHIPEEGTRVAWPGPAGHWQRAEARGEIRSEEIPVATEDRDVVNQSNATSGSKATAGRGRS